MRFRNANEPIQVNARINLFTLRSDDYVFLAWTGQEHHQVGVHIHPEGEKPHGTHEGWTGQRGYLQILGNLHAHFAPEWNKPYGHH